MPALELRTNESVKMNTNRMDHESIAVIRNLTQVIFEMSQQKNLSLQARNAALSCAFGLAVKEGSFERIMEIIFNIVSKTATVSKNTTIISDVSDEKRIAEAKDRQKNKCQLDIARVDVGRYLRDILELAEAITRRQDLGRSVDTESTSICAQSPSLVFASCHISDKKSSEKSESTSEHLIDLSKRFGASDVSLIDACGERIVALGNDQRVYELRYTRDSRKEEMTEESDDNISNNGFSKFGIFRFPTTQHRAVRVACGASHTLAMLSNGEVYSWGESTYGRLGLGSQSCLRNDDVVSRPRRIDALLGISVADISCGVTFSMALTIDGCAFVWGDNRHGQCGISSQVEAVHYPTGLAALSKERIVQVAGGRAHTLVLSAQGRCWTLGGDTIDIRIRQNVRQYYISKSAGQGNLTHAAHLMRSTSKSGSHLFHADGTIASQSHATAVCGRGDEEIQGS
eukprot:g371.t1